ncbi:hypothetical protein GCM10025868_00960 [Angustibacter aerolatus]|uniref:Aldose 1-epimerase n=1 Tax=Angustibacter aerolatus TaxID=1162965 RepID=A0ABQ6JDI8_9ACTN|nr:hypothetical protein GCM10025868_00960 [Angustibacter aerolatus]
MGGVPAPYGIGFHPWLSPGPGGVDACTLEVAAAGHVVVDDRLLPRGVDGVDLDPAHEWRTARPLRDVLLDDAYVEVERAADGRSWARLAGDDGHVVEVWMDDACRAWQVCTGDAVEDVAHRRRGVAVEPMTCVADAFRTGDDLVVLPPGATHRVRWGVGLRRPA